MKIKSGAVVQFEAYSQFKSVEEFLQHVERLLVDYEKELTQKEWVALSMLAQYSTIIPGVSNPTIAVMLEFIQEKDYDKMISRATFKRMLTKAKALGILTVVETEKENGFQLSNLYIFNK
ncbi:hypothetical protein [Bacillus tuaregi]|uniref:hypothetical protein n=1 Tax=Bacillus tuaregi TaxID=1816695 RepID=UPI0008F7FD4A|nr:hypothetical protein [Bacillus tuaregi]